MKRAGLLLLVSTLALAGCGGGDAGPKPVPKDAVAIVGDDPVTRAEFEAMLAATMSGLLAQSRDVPRPGTKAARDLRNRVLDDFVQASEFSQRAKSELDVEVSDAQVEQRVQQLKNRVYGGSQSRYVAGLRSQGLSDLQMRQRFRAQLLADAVFAKLGEETSVSDDDAKAYYDAHRKGYQHPATREVRSITVATKAQAERIERQVRGGADFAKLAETASIDPATASDGGLVTFTRGQTLPGLVTAAFALKDGDVSAPVQTTNGWHVLKAVGPLHEDSLTPFEQVRPVIEGLLLQQARQNRMSSWVKDVRAEFAKKTAYAPGFGPAAKGPAPAGQGD